MLIGENGEPRLKCKEVALSMRRILLVLTVAALMVAIVATSALPALANLRRIPGAWQFRSGPCVPRP